MEDTYKLSADIVNPDDGLMASIPPSDRRVVTFLLRVMRYVAIDYPTGLHLDKLFLLVFRLVTHVYVFYALALRGPQQAGDPAREYGGCFAREDIR